MHNLMYVKYHFWIVYKIFEKVYFLKFILPCIFLDYFSRDFFPTLFLRGLFDRVFVYVLFSFYFALRRARYNLHPPIVSVFRLRPEEVDVVLILQLEHKILPYVIFRRRRPNAIP